MSSETSISKKIVVAIVKKSVPKSFSKLLKQYRQVRGDDDGGTSDMRDAIKELSTGDEPQLTVVQYKTPEDDKFKWLIFPKGTEFIFPESEAEREAEREAAEAAEAEREAELERALSEASADDSDLDALEVEAERMDITSIPLSDDLFGGYLVLGQGSEGTTADFVGSKLQAQANFLKHAGLLGVENVQLFGAVPIRFQIETYAVPASQVRAVEDEDESESIAPLGEADVATSHVQITTPDATIPASTDLSITV